MREAWIALLSESELVKYPASTRFEFLFMSVFIIVRNVIKTSTFSFPVLRLCKTYTGNTGYTEKRQLQKIWQSKSILFIPSVYKKQSNTFCWKANCKRTLFDVTSTWNSYASLTKVLWEHVSGSDLTVETYTLPRITTMILNHVFSIKFCTMLCILIKSFFYFTSLIFHFVI